MKLHRLGTSDLLVSPVSFGCMSLGDDHAANARLLHQALDGGINLFDTADLYQKGENEVSVGKAFRGRRADVVLATKVGNQWRPDGSGWDWNPTKAYILQAAEASLRRLQTDYLDLYQLHGGTIEDPLDESIEAFEQLKQQGKIRAYGISSIRPNVIREYLRRADLASVMLQYSLLDRRPEEAVLALLAEHGVGVLVRGSLAQGLLAGKPAKSYLNFPADEVERRVQAAQAAGAPQPLAETAVGYVRAQPAVSSVVLGIRTEAQLRQALSFGQSAPLAEGTLAALKRIGTPNSYEQHR